MTHLRSRREAALDVLLAVDTREAYAALAVDAALTEAPSRGSGSRLRYGGRLRHAAAARHHRLDAGPMQQTAPLNPSIRRSATLSALAVYEMCFMRTVPGPVACHEAVALAKRRGPRRPRASSTRFAAPCCAATRPMNGRGLPWLKTPSRPSRC